MGGKKKGGKKGKSGGSNNNNHPKQPTSDSSPVPPAVDSQPSVIPQGVVGFGGGALIILRCPSHKYESTVAFYRDILGLRLKQREHQREAIACCFEWSDDANLTVVRIDKLTHPTIWLTVDATDLPQGQDIFEKSSLLRTDITETLPEGVEGFWSAPPNDMVHIIKSVESSLAQYPTAANTTKTTVSSAIGVDKIIEEDDERSANPLNVSAASHAPQGQKGKITSCSFTGGRNIAIKCPKSKYESTVSFYRETLGLEVAHYCQFCCKIKWRGGMSLWIDSVEGLCATAVWLQVSTANTFTARAYLKGRKKVTLRPEVC